jgi:hypothetical protein
MIRRGYLGPTEQAWLAGVSQAHTEVYDRASILFDRASLPRPVEPIPASKMIYVLGFQGGIDKFVMPPSPYSAKSGDSLLSKRIVTPKNPCTEAAELIDGLKQSRISKASKWDATKALDFVHDLIVGMKNGTAVINVSSLPTQDNVRAALPPDLALPICRILSSISTTDELLPAPKGLLGNEPLKRFDDLLTSQIFSGYTAAHLAIESDAKLSSFENLRHYGQKLLQQGNEILNNRRVTLNVLPVAARLIDLGFGKLPGELAKIASDSAARFIADRNNIVIYQFEDCMRSYMDDKIVHLLCDMVSQPEIINDLLADKNKG